MRHRTATAIAIATMTSRWFRRLGPVLAVGVLLVQPLTGAATEDFPEYRLKAAFLYNFAVLTEWPAEVGPTLQLCVLGTDPFGRDLDTLAGKPAGARSVQVQRKAAGEPLRGCQMVFITASAIGSLPRLIDEVRGQPVLLVADTPGAAGHGAALNLSVAASGKVAFAANLSAARSARLQLSSRLLRLAAEVLQ